MHSEPFRAASAFLAAAVVFTSVPVYPAELVVRPSQTSVASEAGAPPPTSEWNPFLLDGMPEAAEALPLTPLLPKLGVGGTASSTPPSTPPPAPPSVTVNRTVPIVDPVPEIPEFPEAPTDADITAARVFGEPFIALGGQTTGEENRALADAILAYLQNGNNEDTSAFGAFLVDHPNSAWRPSLLANLGAHYQRTGYYTLAGETLQEAWDLTRHPSTPAGLPVTLSVLADFLELKMKFGNVDELETILSQAEGLELHGTAVERVSQAKMAVYVLNEAHHEAITSGSVSVDNFLRSQTPGYKQHPEIAKFPAKHEGASLAEVRDLAGRTGLSMQMARRPVDQNDIPIPSIIHLKSGHFSAVVKQAGERFLLLDPMLGGEMWFSRAALQAEASGYFLTPPGPLPTGWSSVTAAQVQNVRGKCQGAIQCEDCRLGPMPCGGPECEGMATYSFNTFLASLQITDVPVWHNPPRGPAIRFAMKYHQRDSNQPQTFTFSNLGRRWRFAWLGYLEDNPSNPNAQVLCEPIDASASVVETS